MQLVVQYLQNLLQLCSVFKDCQTFISSHIYIEIQKFLQNDSWFLRYTRCNFLNHQYKCFKCFEYFCI